ncbi:hypothetical protein ABFP60_15480 [Clostridioides difficile]
MKNKSKIMFMLIVGVLLISLGYNFYQQNKINNYKTELSFNVRKNLQKFAGYGGNIDNNETIYAEQYASIVAAQQSYIALSDNKGIPSDQWSSSLPGLFIEIKDVMINDKEKFKEVFAEMDTSTLIFKIADNFDDKDSISKVYELLVK